MRLELDDEFPNHPKVVKAGELAAYLHVVSMCYCRRHLTGGFLPREAVPALRPGPTTRKLVDALLETGLWVAVDGGFQIHGYAERYDDATMKARADEKRKNRRIAGSAGGKASWNKRQPKQNEAFASSKTDDLVQASASAVVQTPSSTVAEPLIGNGSGNGGSVETWREPEGGPPFDVWFVELQELYPRFRVSGGYLTQSAFVEQFQRDTRPARAVWAEMQANLENQKHGHEWRERKMVPTLEKWLRLELWKQVHEADAPADPRKSGGVDARLLVREEATAVADCPHVEPCASRLVCQRKRTQPDVYPIRSEVSV